MTASEDEMEELGLGRAEPEGSVRGLVEILVEKGATSAVARELTLAGFAEFAPAWMRELRSRLA